MKRINYKSDFDFILALRSCNGIELGWPAFSWSARFWTSSKAQCFEASCIGGERRNCLDDGGRIRVVANDHRLQPGKLQCELHMRMPSEAYADGVMDVFEPAPLDIELVAGPGDCPTAVESILTLPCIKGEKGDKGDPGEPGGAQASEEAVEAALEKFRLTEEDIDSLLAE